jgi:hypothetical protein
MAEHCSNNVAKMTGQKLKIADALSKWLSKPRK